MVDRLIGKLDRPQLPHPNCFFLDWKTKTAVWCDLKDETDIIKFQVNVNWSELGLKITLASNCTPGDTVQTTSEIPVSYLKSHLQKSIRRSNPYKSLKTASALIRTDPGEFLRRVLIIAIEDSLPLDGYAVLTWFMSATSKGYTMNQEQIDYCLGYTYDLAKSTNYERFMVEEQQRIPELRGIPDEGKNLVYSILFREAYGGLPNDKKLCRQICNLWVKRWHTGSSHLQLLKRQVKFISPATDSLHFNDWYLAALDFHCCPNLIQHVHEKFDQYSEHQIKLAIWHDSSCLTNKKNISASSTTQDFHGQIWSAIKKVVHAYATYIIYKM